MSKEEAIKEFRALLEDPVGKYRKALYRSFSKSQDVKMALAAEISVKYNVMPSVLLNDALMQLAAALGNDFVNPIPYVKLESRTL